jgi:hypothetical protein
MPASKFVSCWLIADGLADNRLAVEDIDFSSAAATNISIPQSVMRPGLSTIISPKNFLHFALN